MKQLSKAKKAEFYDGMEQNYRKLSLALYDLANRKFGPSVKVHIKDYEFTRDGGYYSVQASFRAMPIFLSRYVCRGQEDLIEVHTEAEIQEAVLQFPLSIYWRMMNDARAQLVARRVGRSI